MVHVDVGTIENPKQILQMIKKRTSQLSSNLTFTERSAFCTAETHREQEAVHTLCIWSVKPNN